MSIGSRRPVQKQNPNRKTTKLGIEQLESRLMNSIDAIETSLHLLTSPGLFGSTQIVSNSPPSVASSSQLGNSTTVVGKTASISVLGADNTSGSSLKYQWQLVEMPTGGTVSFALNNSNAAKNNLLTFNKSGAYQVSVTVLDAQGHSAKISLQFNVKQTLTYIDVTTPTGEPINPTVAVGVTTKSQNFVVRGFDQFGNAITTIPKVSWTTTSAPSGGMATASQNSNVVTISFTRAGIYTLRATADNATRNISINVLQTVTSMSVSPGTSSLQTNASQQFRYQTLDQFGQSIANQPAAVWTTTGGTIASSGLLNTGTRAGTFTVTAKVGAISGTASFEVTAPTPAPTPPTPPAPPPTPAPQGPLHNAAIASLVSSLYLDGTLTRAEMIQVLKSAGSDGVVDATELADLRYISSSGSIYAMPAYIRELAKDVVNSNPANLQFKGQSAGNLAAGSSATLLNNLVDKWFFGADEPALSSVSLSYQTVVGNLFNGAPSRNDDKQGQLGDCYFIAALSAIADRSPDAVRNLFIDNSDGTYTVRFYAQAGHADYVTVNRRLPTNSTGRLEYSGYGLSIASSTTTLWIALAEKAYAQWNETGNEGRDGTNRYSAIEGGWMSYVNAQVLGSNSSNYAFSTTPKASLVSAIAAGRSVTLGTKSVAADGLYGNHAYTVTGYNSSTDTFSLYNPWGTAHPSPLTWAQLQANCSMFTVADPSGSAANNLLAVRSALSETFVGNWTTVVVVRADTTIGAIRETQYMEMGDPILSILGSSLDEKSGNINLEVAGTSARSYNEIADTDEVKFSTPLAALLVDLAISHMDLSKV